MKNFSAKDYALRFAAAHYGVRIRLGKWLGVSPPLLHIATAEGGKPWLPDHPYAQFNLSHTNDFAMLAIARTSVGADIERILDPRDITPGLRSLVLTPLEADNIIGLNPLQLAERFIEYWVCKEALIKATGAGFKMSPTDINIDLESGNAILYGSWEDRVGSGWRCWLVEAPQLHRAAVCINQTNELRLS